MQKHTNPTLAQTQTREALNLARHYFGNCHNLSKGEISQAEKAKQAEIEMSRNFGQRCLWYLQDLGFKVYRP